MTLPSAIYLWIVPSEHMLDQPGSWRIRKWDTEPFPEATHTANTQSSAEGACKVSPTCVVYGCATPRLEWRKRSWEYQLPLKETVYDLRGRENPVKLAYLIDNYWYTLTLLAPVKDAPFSPAWEPSTTQSANRPTIPAELFDGMAVYVALGEKSGISPRDVSAVLDAVVRLIRANRG